MKEIKNSPFKNLRKIFYFGKIKYHCPYFLPRNFIPTIVFIRFLKKTPKDAYEEKVKRFPWNKENSKYTNLPMVRRSKSWVLWDKLYIEIGYPISICNLKLGWKDKFNSPRFDWNPAFFIFFFKWQFCIHYTPPTKDYDNYWEMYLWWKFYCNEDLEKAERTWGWTNSETDKSTWRKNNLK